MFPVALSTLAEVVKPTLRGMALLTGVAMVATLAGTYVGASIWLRNQSFARTIWDGQLTNTYWYTVVFFPLAAYNGLKTLVHNGKLIADLLTATDAERLKELPQKRVVVEGNATPASETVTSPVSMEDSVLTKWKVEAYDENDQVWYTVESGVRMSPFHITDDHGEVRVDAEADALDIVFQDDHQSVLEAEDVPRSELPKHIERYLDTHQEYGSNLRFVEHRIEPGDPIGGCGRVTDTNVNGRWKRTFVTDDWIGIGDDSRTVKGVFWVRAFTNLFWSAALIELSLGITYLFATGFII